MTLESQLKVPSAAKPEGDRGLGWGKFVTVVSSAAILVHMLLRVFAVSSNVLVEAPLYAALVLGGAPLVAILARKLWLGQLGADFLAGASIVTAVLLREYLVATIVVLMFSGGTTLESFATRRASRVLEALAKRVPIVAHRKTDKGLTDIPVREIGVGDTLAVLPHEICPVDGTVAEGRGSMNEAYLTGEPFEVEKAP